MKQVIVIVRGGLVQGYETSEDIEVIVHDYDIESLTDDELKSCEMDNNGNQYEVYQP